MIPSFLVSGKELTDFSITYTLFERTSLVMNRPEVSKLQGQSRCIIYEQETKFSNYVGGTR